MDSSPKTTSSVSSRNSISTEVLKRSMSNEAGPFKELTFQHGSIESLIKLALCEFDENGSVVRPPAVTIVLLTMHRWFISSQDFLAKLVQIYQKHKARTVDSPSAAGDDSVFEDSPSYNDVNGGRDSSKLASIVETRESGDELNGDEETVTGKNRAPVPSISVNGVLQNSESQNGNLGQKSLTSGDISGLDEPVRDSMPDATVTAGSNNERSELVSTVSGPTFDVALDEPCAVAHARPADEVVTEEPEVRVKRVEEKSPELKSKNESTDKPGNGLTQSESERSEAEEGSESESVQVINVWIICQFLNYWMSRFGGDLRANENILHDITHFKLFLINENKEDEKRIKHLIGRSVVGSGELSGHSGRLSRQREVARAKSLAFKDLSPKDIAEQLTHIDCRSLKKIPISEWKTYARKTKLSDVPSLEKYVMRFNGLSRWIEAMVLNGATPEIRAHIIDKFLKVAQCLRQHQNFNSLMAVIGALNHSALRRLHQTMAVVSEDEKKETTQTIEENLENVKDFMFLYCVHLKDLIAVDTALPDYISDKKFINFQKMVRFYTIIATLMNFRKMPPPAPSKFELVNMLRLSIQMTITEDELYELSYAREPRKGGTMPNSDKADSQNSELFADWASGRAATPDSRTIDKHVTSMVEAVFKFYDRDSDGLLTTGDFEAISTNFPFIDSFGEVDANRDGVVTKEEMKTYFFKANYRVWGKEFVHNFQETTYLTPRNFCEHCGGVLWGLIKQGFKCKDCGINCHKACKGQVVVDCRPKNLAPASPNYSSSTLERAANKAENIRNKLMNRRKSRHTGANSESDLSRNDQVVMDEVDSVAVKLEKSDQACKVLLEENKRLKDENDKLDSDLTEAQEKIRQLETKLKLVRQETITFVLEQLDALQLRRNTAV